MVCQLSQSIVWNVTHEAGTQTPLQISLVWTSVLLLRHRSPVVLWHIHLEPSANVCLSGTVFSFFFQSQCSHKLFPDMNSGKCADFIAYLKAATAAYTHMHYTTSPLINILIPFVYYSHCIPTWNEARGSGLIWDIVVGVWVHCRRLSGLCCLQSCRVGSECAKTCQEQVCGGLNGWS